MPWIGPVLGAVSAITGVYSAVNSSIQGERAEDLANEQARDQRNYGAASLLEQKNFNARQLALQAPGVNYGSNFAEDPAASLLGENDNTSMVPGLNNSLFNYGKNNVTTWM